MSVKHALLALLDQRPMYGYQLKSEFEARVGQAWPLNIGQVYTTLVRLERDELVAAEPVTDAGAAPTASPPPGGPSSADGSRPRSRATGSIGMSCWSR
jgi:hypothetical protein